MATLYFLLSELPGSTSATFVTRATADKRHEWKRRCYRYRPSYVRSQDSASLALTKLLRRLHFRELQVHAHSLRKIVLLTI